MEVEVDSRSPAEAERGRTEETAGASEVAGKRGMPAFCSNFLERRTQTNSIGQLEWERGKRKERRGEAAAS